MEECRNERETETIIWDSVTKGESFMYDLRSHSLDAEEWVFVRLPRDSLDLDEYEITWKEFIELEPSFRPLGVWYKAHHRYDDDILDEEESDHHEDGNEDEAYD